MIGSLDYFCVRVRKLSLICGKNVKILNISIRINFLWLFYSYLNENLAPFELELKCIRKAVTFLMSFFLKKWTRGMNAELREDKRIDASLYINYLWLSDVKLINKSRNDVWGLSCLCLRKIT